MPISISNASAASKFILTFISIVDAGSPVHSLDAQTLPDSTPPQPVGKVSAITETSFTFKYKQDEPGIAYFVLLVLADQDRYRAALQPGEMIAQVPAGFLGQEKAFPSSVSLSCRQTSVLTLHKLNDPCAVQLQVPS
jgi:hypothetical protein